MRTEDVIRLIKESKKKTPCTAWVSGDLGGFAPEGVVFVGGKDFGILTGDRAEIEKVLSENSSIIKAFHMETSARNSAIPLADLTKYDARIEPGAVIRDMVDVRPGVVVMMGAVINIGAVIGERTMIDMNVVVGGRAQIGADCHIGAGAVVAGVIEPPSATPVVIEDKVLVGANAVSLEGVRVGRGSVVAAGAVVTADVPPRTVVAGSPARVIKAVDEKTESKTEIVQDLRNLD